MYFDIESKIKELDISVKSLRKTGTEYAKAEQDYKMKLREEALKLKDKGTPVTFIGQIIYGVPEVARLRFERDVKEAVYKANQESINSIKLQIRIINEQLSREWGQAKYE